MAKQRQIGRLVALTLMLGLSSCSQQQRLTEHIAFDPRSSSNAMYMVDRDAFPQDHWACHAVKETDLDRVKVIISETNESRDTTESICGPGLFLYETIAHRVLNVPMYDRVRYWNGVRSKAD